jgi:hypothetical protein
MSLKHIPPFTQLYYDASDLVTNIDKTPCHCLHHQPTDEINEIDPRCIASEESLDHGFYMVCNQHAITPRKFQDWCSANRWIQYDWKTQTWNLTDSYTHMICPMCQLLEEQPSLRPIEEYLYVDWIYMEPNTYTLSYWIPKANMAYTMEHWNVGDCIPVKIISYQQYQESSEQLEQNDRIEYQWFMNQNECVPVEYHSDTQCLIVPYSLCQILGYTHYSQPQRFPWCITWCMELDAFGHEYLYVTKEGTITWIEPMYYEQNENVLEEEGNEHWEKKWNSVEKEEEETEEEEEETEIKPEEDEIILGTLTQNKEELMIWNGKQEWETVSSTIYYPNTLSQMHGLNYYVYYCEMWNQTMKMMISPMEYLEIPSCQVNIIDTIESNLVE